MTRNPGTWLKLGLLSACFVGLGLAPPAAAGREGSVALGADYTLLRDDVSSVGTSYRGVIPTLRFAYDATNDDRIHGARLRLAMGNPTLPHGFTALLMHPSAGYRYVRGLPETGGTDLYAGGGLLTHGYFLTSNLGRVTYLYDNSLTANAELRRGMGRGTLSVSAEISLLSLVARSPYSVSSPDLRYALTGVQRVLTFEAKLQTPVRFLRSGLSVGYTVPVGKRSWRLRPVYGLELVRYRRPAALEFALLAHSLRLDVGV